MLNETLIANLGSPLYSAVPIAGGDINEAFRLTLENGTLVFMKANTRARPSFFQTEVNGLEALRANGAIRVPRVIAIGHDDHYGSFLLLEWIQSIRRSPDFWETFGHSLARMHIVPSDGFGWENNNYIGTSPQINAPRDNWVAFFRDCRLAPQFKNAHHYFDSSTHKRIMRLLDHLEDFLTEPPHPSLLHGDLWSGNFITGNDGQAWLIDPAVYSGHAEADLAMTELFGGFHPAFYSAYEQINPLQPGYERRRDLYNLYHLLNHLNLFGGGYLSSVLRVLNAYV